MLSSLYNTLCNLFRDKSFIQYYGYPTLVLAPRLSTAQIVYAMLVPSVTVFLIISVCNARMGLIVPDLIHLLQVHAGTQFYALQNTLKASTIAGMQIISSFVVLHGGSVP